ncbi:hypothetical protein [Streptomyces sp. NPDC058157]|uniref:hypothetical protein n=1 Tax=Streptomyces sp. NPDC058157 TaxID=3346360 RepID=UPI0036E71DCE
MCHYCGCRQILLIKEFISEHETVRTRRATSDKAGTLLTAGQAVLLAHWKGEEDGLFAVMSHDPEYAPCIEALVSEHRDLAAFRTMADLSSLNSSSSDSGSGTARGTLGTALDGPTSPEAARIDGWHPPALRCSRPLTLPSTTAVAPRRGPARSHLAGLGYPNELRPRPEGTGPQA